MVKCYIIEDEPLARDILKRYIDDHPKLELFGVSSDPLTALDVLAQGKIDLLFLDINLPKISGVSFYRSLSTRPPVIFTTAYAEFAVEGFEVNAVDYLVKPFSFDRFLTAVSKLKAVEDGHVDFLIIKNDKKAFRIPLEEIAYIESIGDYVKVHTRDQVLLSSDTLKGLVDTLPDREFARVHKSFIVSLSAISYLEGNRLKIGETMIPVGYAYREKVTSLFKK